MPEYHLSTPKAEHLVAIVSPMWRTAGPAWVVFWDSIDSAARALCSRMHGQGAGARNEMTTLWQRKDAESPWKRIA